MIDAHHHVWQLGRAGVAWPTADLKAIHRDFDLRELRTLAEPLGFTGSVLVQSQPDAGDTDWLLDLAEADGFVEGVVGWVDLEAADAPARIAALAARPKLRGLRPMLQNLPKDDWICAPALEPAIAAMIAHGLRFDALVFPRHLPYLRVFASRHPGLRIVIDHAAKPAVASGVYSAWAQDMEALAALPNIWCKFSGLLTELAARQPRGDLHRYIAHLLKVFGPRRIMWGSDWPVIDLMSDYTDWYMFARGFVAPDDRAAVFGETARQFYGLGDG
jgi:L-fuconolactonase